MRLLKASSITNSDGLELTTFSPAFVPPYAILSHTWGHDEVLYHDIADRTSHERAAFRKCSYACEQTLADGLEYVWIDTCCIDKSSSAELSEAINSMFEWYRRSTVCYAFMEDYMTEKGGCSSICDSKWFTRGWTLQELLAPPRLIFYAAGWNEIGTKEDLGSDISTFTNISADILIGRRPMETASVANRMGWAAHRDTTRPEDIAYCLMGIFNVNMPLLYGEGMAKAFFRLQEQIMKDSTDHTLFAWIDDYADDETEYGMLAPSPRCFASTSMLIPYEEPADRAPHAWTNKGLMIQLRLTPDHGSPINFPYQATLNCPPPDFEEACFLTIYLKQTNFNVKCYARVRASRLGRIRESIASAGESGGDGLGSRKDVLQQIYVKKTDRRMKFEADMVYPFHLLTVDTNFSVTRTYRLERAATFATGEPRGGQSLRCLPIRRGAGLITAVLIVVRKDRGKSCLRVVFGSKDPLRLAFDVQELDIDLAKEPIPPHGIIQKSFNPRNLGDEVELKHHRVSVGLENTEVDPLQGRSKTYYVKLCVNEVEAPPSFEEVVLMDRRAEVGSEQQEKKGKVTERMKKLFGGSSKEV